MHISNFDLYRDLLKEKSGLTLTPDKAYLLESRLTPVAKKWGYSSLDTMCMALRGVPDPNLIKDVVEAMTTNETSFFRDSKPFDLFRDYMLPEMMKSRASAKKLRIWCAAASSGQEPYSLSMLLKEKGAALNGWTIEIVGTDISTEILDTAKRGEYSQFEVQRGLPITLLMKYFEQKGEKWCLKDDIKKMVKYQYFNLLDSMAALGKFDLVFCRNVLIYFDRDTKADILNRMAKQMAPDSMLVLGGAETVMGITETFKPLADKRGLYVKNEAPAAAAGGKALAT
jgi:chemotaxis protein methyltransferase CheR